jgi:eukaryotic-like serine/threonine-protein kinase
MTPEELSRIREIYEQALPMSGAAREAHLDRACQGQRIIREGVERLLQARENVPTWLDRPAVDAVRPLVAPELPQVEGRHLSGYTLIREIGRGGMGAVYLAERSDETFHRRAAIKLVLPPANSAAVIARFQQEREILASLDHPNIAKLLDAGVTEEGWPYFVMEFVDGQPIHRWCDQRKLNISQRLELFRGVIDAVRYAHQHLVVHRDLKPSNIFVTNDGVVKLLDFGIAKVLAASIPGEALETLTLAGMMTPEYASPEQVNGTAITTLSDVYSLGVVLYELLTGHRPYRLLSAAMHELARVIAEVEPARPSDVVAISEPASGRDRTAITPDMVSAVREGEPNRLRKRLAGDLDSILLMALRKEPARRYGSVESFAEDLQRHLEQRPVHAREASPWERFQNFRRRNPGGLATGVVITILFLAGLATVFVQARHDILAARLDRGVVLFLAPLWLFSSGIAAAALCAAVYFARPNRRQKLGAAFGGLAFGLGLIGRMRLESSLGLWRSRIESNDDPLMLLSPLTWFVSFFGSVALLVVLLMIGRRFGSKGQVLSLAILGLYQAVRERFWFGEFIPALDFQPGPIPILGSAGMIFAAGSIGLLTMRLIGGADDTTRTRK